MYEFSTPTVLQHRVLRVGYGLFSAQQVKREVGYAGCSLVPFSRDAAGLSLHASEPVIAEIFRLCRINDRDNATQRVLASRQSVV